MSKSLSSIFEKDWKEGIDPIDLLKRSTVSESIPLILKKRLTGELWCFSRSNQSFVLLITKNERFAHFCTLLCPKQNYFFMQIHLIFYHRKINSIKKDRSCALLKIATMSESILSIFKKDRPRANRSRQSLKKIAVKDSIFSTIESIFWSQKTMDLIKKPLIKFPPSPNHWNPIPSQWDPVSNPWDPSPNPWDPAPNQWDPAPNPLDPIPNQWDPCSINFYR